jgi:hypothetical protein
MYIGKTTNPNGRKSNHKKTYGSQIMFTVIDSINSDKHRDWKPLESYWIEQFRNWEFEIMNINKGGAGPEYYSEESKLKMSLAAKGKPKSEETKLKMSLAAKGRKRSEEFKLRISQKLKGKSKSEETKAKMRQPKSEEHKLNMSLAGKGKLKSEEHKLKISLASKGHTRNIGRHHSEETKAKMRQPKSAEAKLKISQAKLGKKYSDEHKLKISQSKLGKKYKKHVFEK